MIKKSKFKKTRKSLTVLSLSTLLLLGASCTSDETEVESIGGTAVLSGKLNSVTEAEDYDSQSGIRIVSSSKIGYVNDGDWIRFDDFEYDGATSVSVKAASANSGGTIEFRTGSSTGGDLLGSVSISNTGGWSDFETFTTSIDDDSSNSDLYVVFKGGSGSLFDVDNFTFSSSNNSGGSSDGTNLALAGSAEQSSTGYGGDASRAIDGNTSGVWNEKSVTHTAANEYQSWWQVRLASNTNIEEIVIWNRTNCCSDRLSNFDVFVYNTDGTQVYKTTITDTPNPSVKINTGGVTGNRVRVKLKDSQALSLAEVQVYGESNGDSVDPDPIDPIDPDPIDPEPGNSGNPTGSDPWDFYVNCDQWKITWVDGSEEKQLCDQDEVANEYEVSSAEDALIFTVQLKDGINSTENSTYPRSELREREEDGSSDVYWTTSGDHALYIEQAITHLPIEKDHIVTGQLHGNKDDGIDDSMVVRLEGDHLFLSFNGGKLRDEVTIKRGYELGDKMEVILRIVDGKHYCYFSEDGNLRTAYNNGNASQYLVSDGGSTVLMDLDYDQTYFKVGNYCQSNEETEGNSFGNSNNYCEVYVYSFNVNHTGGNL